MIKQNFTAYTRPYWNSAKLQNKISEKKLEEDSEKKKVLVAKLSSGMKLDFAAVKKELSDVEKSLEQTELEWLAAADEVEALRLENARINEQ